MTAIPPSAPAGPSLWQVWDRVGERTEQLAAQVADGGLVDGSYVQTVIELQSLQLQADAAGMIFQTLQDLSDDLLARPRR